jgi:hypothetical protein
LHRPPWPLRLDQDGSKASRFARDRGPVPVPRPRCVARPVSRGGERSISDAIARSPVPRRIADLPRGSGPLAEQLRRLAVSIS